jgi:hypothetical protein
MFFAGNPVDIHFFQVIRWGILFIPLVSCFTFSLSLQGVFLPEYFGE